MKMWYSLKACLISLAVLWCPDVCAYFPFMHLMARLTGMKAKPGWWSLCLNLTVYFLCRGGSQITTHVVLSVIASRLQGNSLSSSRRPSICCCPFVSSSIHRSEKENRLWRFLFLVFSPYVWPCEASLSRHMSTCSLLLSADLRIVIMTRMDAANALTHAHMSPGGGGELQVESSCRWSSTK